MWQAARYGLERRLVDPETGSAGAPRAVIRSAVARLGAALDAHGDRAGVEAGVERILVRGNGATWQRQVGARVGLHGLVGEIAARTTG